MFTKAIQHTSIKHIAIIAAATLVGCLGGYFIDSRLFMVNPVWCAFVDGALFCAVHAIFLLKGGAKQ